MPFRSATPSLVPYSEVAVHIVFDDFGNAGWIYRETDERGTSLEAVVDDLLTGQFQNPERVVAFNTSEGWSRDVSEDVAREIVRRVAECGRQLASNSRQFVEIYVNKNELLRAENGLRKMAKGYNLDKIAAVHETGHAVARYLSADAMGFRASEAIDYIEIAPPFSRPSLGAKSILAPTPAIIGPVYSRPMMVFLKTDSISLDLTAAVEACKAHGIDVEMWAAVKAFICMAGAAAEALFTSRSFSEIASECENDLEDAMRYCLAAGITTQEASKVCNGALNWAREVFDDPRNWTAVLALADSLPSGGSINGNQIESIIARAMHGAAGLENIPRRSHSIGAE
jgi:hypothetical protein